jgi:hypothetical protein
MKKALLFLMLLLLSGSFALAQPCYDDTPTSPGDITPTLVSGNPALCTGGVRLDPPDGGTHILYGSLTIEIVYSNTPCGQVFSWSVSPGIVIDQIVVKGGPNANVYDYTGTGLTSDGMLHSPLTGGSENPTYADVSHIDVCFHFELTISKTAETSFKRTYEWEIDKVCDGDEEILLAVGQTYPYDFYWTATVVDSVDSDWYVEGEIKIKNETPFDAEITSITDMITGIGAVVPDCGITLPYILLAGDSIVCTYSSDLPDATTRTNTATVVTSSAVVVGGTANASVDFGDATIITVDSCITVTDNMGNDPVEVCLDDSPYKEEYTIDLGPYTECDDTNYVDNIASFTTADLALTDADTCTVRVITPPCGEGCTLTPGYWKTHSIYGPAPYDDTWADREYDPFFFSGKTWYEVLWTPPSGGNAYYILAHAFIAAQLNIDNGASMPAEVETAFKAAFVLFNTAGNTPEYVGTLKGAAKNVWINLAMILDDYNNGITGPGHCSEPGEIMEKETAETPEVSTINIIPENYSLSQNYPNPFNPVTVISFGLPEGGMVTLKIYDMLGNEITTLVNNYISAGMHNVDFNAANLPSGVYLYRLQSGSFIQTNKMILMK